MRYLSVCSGIEAASVAWHPLGWEPVAFAEVEPFPSAVLAHHYPDAPNVGDMTRYQEWPDATFDVLVGGTPCQSFSVAGKRGGMDDPRGQLVYAFAGIAARYRPEWIVWENVPGVLSSNGGRDFAGFVRGLGELGYQCAWRIFDAQFFGVPQRRRRLFLIGNSGGWQRAAAVLFERESMLGNPPPSRKAREVAPTIPARSTGGGGLGTDFDCDGGVVHVCPTLRAGGNRTGGDRPPGTDVDTADSLIVAHSLRGEGFDASEDGTGRGTPLVAVAFTGDGITADPITANEAKTYTQEGNTFRLHNCVGEPVAVAIRTANTSANGHGISPELAHTLDQAQGQAVAVGTDCFNGDITGDVAATMGTRGSSQNASGPTVMQSMQVRRLTPVECERLQGFPDDYTLIPWRNKPADQCPDGPRYKALGNSMAVPVMRWIGRRIDAVAAIKRGAA